jgi:NodT family efflux transporter outer membrane factor (OMF) lipoprotein
MTTSASPSTSNLRRLAAVACAAAVLLSGCSLGPKYKRPTLDTPASYKEASAGGDGVWRPADPKDSIQRGKWWEIFEDERLNGLEEKAAAANQSIKVAAAQYREARAQVAFARSSYFPSISLQPSMTRGLELTGTSNQHGIENNFDLPAVASWEPDFWGQIGLNVENAASNAAASAAALENAKLSVQAQLAGDYFQMEENDNEQILLSSAIASYQIALDLTQNRFNAGIASQADVMQARTQLDTTKAQATDLSVARSQFEHAIAVLVGEPPSAFSLSTGTITRVPPPIPVGVPSQLLERRPDVATAERQVAAANATVGLTRTAFFPIISLTASAGYQSSSWAQWISWPNHVWSLGAATAQTIFDFGGRLAELHGAKAAYDASVANYRQTALSAFQEVEDQMSALSYLSQEAGQQDAATREAEQSLTLEIQRYKAGIDSYLNVITTQNIALTNERTSSQILGRRMVAAVTLISDLGGGWDQKLIPTGRALASDKEPADATATAAKPR